LIPGQAFIFEALKCFIFGYLLCFLKLHGSSIPDNFVHCVSILLPPCHVQMVAVTRAGGADAHSWHLLDTRPDREKTVEHERTVESRPVLALSACFYVFKCWDLNLYTIHYKCIHYTLQMYRVSTNVYLKCISCCRLPRGLERQGRCWAACWLCSALPLRPS